MKYIVAHDTGTGGDKAVITDIRGSILHSVYSAYPLEYPETGWVEQNPELIWQTVAKTTLRVIGESGIDAGEIAGIGITAQMFNLLPVDERGKPLMHMISWLDERSVHEADKITAETWDGGNWRELFSNITGNIPMAKDIVPKILWLRDNAAEIWKKTYKLLDCKEYLIFKLTGEYFTDYHGASVFFLTDYISGKWSQPLLEKIGIPLHMLPGIRRPIETAGEVTEEAARISGLKAGTPVVLCAGDVAAAQTGAGANRAGEVHLSLGTATWLGVSSKKPLNNSKSAFWTLRHADYKKFIVAGEMETGGGALMWLRDKFLGPAGGEAEGAEKTGSRGPALPYAALSSLAEKAPPGSDKLIFAPWLSGERAPVLDHYAKGGFVGINLNHGKEHFVRSVMEGVGFQLKWIMDEMEKTGLEIGKIHAVGGGLKSKVWPQIISDILGCSLHIVRDPENAGAAGTALITAVGLGFINSVDSIDELISFSKVIRPNVENRKIYDNLYGIYRGIYKELYPLYHRIEFLF
ncbi:MAG: FGGY-family carbohydrate kinase [Spirochaetales bacterium]|nr:FGGY-family carbohydrate kinase [Spirochaetales bacterium]